MVGGVPVGGGAPVSIQSMLNTRTTDVEGSLRQIRALAAAGCEIARLAVPDMQAAEAFGEICQASPLPLVADIHFDYRLAIARGGKRCSQDPHQPRQHRRRKRMCARCGRSACARHGISRSASASTPALWSATSLQRYGGPTAEAHGGKRPSTTSRMLGAAPVGMTSFVSFKASTVPPHRCEACRLCGQTLRTTRSTSASPRPAPSEWRHRQIAPWASARFCARRHRRHHPRLADRRPRAGGRRRPRTSCRPLGLRRDGVEVVSCPTCGRTAHRPRSRLAKQV